MGFQIRGISVRTRTGTRMVIRAFPTICADLIIVRMCPTINRRIRMAMTWAIHAITVPSQPTPISLTAITTVPEMPANPS